MKADDFRAEVKFAGRISLLDQAASSRVSQLPGSPKAAQLGSQPSSPIVLHILLSHSHQPRFHRPYCLPLNSLTSFNPEYTKLLKLCVSEQNHKKCFAANTSLSLIPSEQSCSLPAERPSIIGSCAKIWNITNKRREDLPQFLNHHILAMLPRTSAWLPAWGDVKEQHMSGSRSRPHWLTSTGSRWETACFEEKMYPLPTVLQKQTQLPPRDNRILARLSPWSRLCLCWLPPPSRTPRKALCSFYSCDIGWERDLPLSWNWKDLKTSHYQKVYKGWDFESVLREVKNLSDINGN